MFAISDNSFKNFENEITYSLILRIKSVVYGGYIRVFLLIRFSLTKNFQTIDFLPFIAIGAFFPSIVIPGYVLDLIYYWIGILQFRFHKKKLCFVLLQPHKTG